jgi:hypothetical protein
MILPENPRLGPERQNRCRKKLQPPFPETDIQHPMKGPPVAGLASALGAEKVDNVNTLSNYQLCHHRRRMAMWRRSEAELMNRCAGGAEDSLFLGWLSLFAQSIGASTE